MAAEDGRPLRLGHRLLPLDGRTVGLMRTTPRSLLATDPAAARQRLKQDGYLLLRGVLAPAAVNQACAAISNVLSEAGWLAEGVDPSLRQARPDFREHELQMNGYSIGGPGLPDAALIQDPKMKGQMYGGFHDLQNHPDVRSVLHSPELFSVAADLFGEPAGALDYRWLRAILPDQLVGHGYCRLQ